MDGRLISLPFPKLKMLTIKKFILGALRVNCYLVFDQAKLAIVIDPGFEEEELLKFIKDNKLKVKKILLTHGHFDHLAGVAQLKKATSAKVAASRLDLPIIEKFSAGRAKIYGYEVKEFKTDELLKNGETIKVGEIEIKVIGTPGHSPGGLCFYLAKEKILFSGDTIFAGAIGRTDLQGSSYNLLMESIIKKLLVLPDDVKVYPGHGWETTIGKENQ